MKQRVCVIGLDGATFRLILPWIRQGELPRIQRLMDQGAWGELESTIHPLSPQAWASFMTGKNPGKHGIFEFVEHKPQSYDLRYVNGGTVRGARLWQILSRNGRRVCVINVPFTYPPVEVNGCLIAGLDAPGADSGFCYPPELLDDITDRFGEYQLRQHPYKATPESFLDKIFTQFDYILNVAAYLKKKEEWDLFVVVFESTDLVQHFYWHYAFPEAFGIAPPGNEDLSRAILDVYKRIDEGLKLLLEPDAPDETVMIMSDHGFSPCRKVFFMDNWLREKGFLSYRQGGGKAFGFARIAHQAFQKYFPNTLKARVVGLIPQLKERLRSYLTTANIDWQHTRAFSLGIDSTNIYINLKGKFPNGTVSPGREYDDIREEIACKLMEVVDPDTGQRVIERVYKREGLYSGGCLEKAPDLLVTWKNFEYNTRRGYASEGEGLFGSSLEFSDVSGYSSLQKSGTHHLMGVFLANGPVIKASGAFEGARIIDVAPTILHLLGVPVPEDMDGRIMEEIFQDNFLASRPLRTSAPDVKEGEPPEAEYGQGEEEYIREKLKGLGYID